MTCRWSQVKAGGCHRRAGHQESSAWGLCSVPTLRGAEPVEHPGEGLVLPAARCPCPRPCRVSVQGHPGLQGRPLFACSSRVGMRARPGDQHHPPPQPARWRGLCQSRATSVLGDCPRQTHQDVDAWPWVPGTGPARKRTVSPGYQSWSQPGSGRSSLGTRHGPPGSGCSALGTGHGPPGRDGAGI